jgi:hypothetical protein
MPADAESMPQTSTRSFRDAAESFSIRSVASSLPSPSRSREATPAIRTWPWPVHNGLFIRRRPVHALPIYVPSAQRRLIGSDGRVTPLIVIHTEFISCQGHRFTFLLDFFHAAVRQRPTSSGRTRPVRRRQRSTARRRASATAAFFFIAAEAFFLGSKTHFHLASGL